MYIIRDCQFEERYFADGAKFKTKKEILDQLASYHNIDFLDCCEEDTPYENIWDYINTFKTFKAQLKWILDYGQWEIVEV